MISPFGEDSISMKLKPLQKFLVLQYISANARENKQNEHNDINPGR